MLQKITASFALLLFVFTFQTFAAAYLTEPSISPSRQEIAFVSGGDIWTVPESGGTAQLLVSHPANETHPLYSPDGKKLAFISNRTGAGDIYILNLETNDLQRLTFDDALDQLDAWSRDGQWIYFSSTSKDIAGMNDIFRVSASGGTPMQVSSDRYTNEFWSAPLADDSIIFSARGISNGQWWRKGRSHIDETEIWEKTGENYRKLTDAGAKQLWVMPTADGKQMFYVSDRNGAQNIWTQANGGVAKQLTNFTDGRVLWAQMSADAKEIVFERNFRIWKMNTDNGKAGEIPITLRGAAASPLTDKVVLSTQIRELALAPDGKKIAVVARGEIFAASSKEAGEAVRITNTPAAENYVAWSPDSRKVVYSSERGGAMQIFQYDFAAETETALTDGKQADALPIYSHDGKYISFIRNARTLFVYDVDKKLEREICGFYADAPPLLNKQSVVWSPDDKWLAFTTYAPENRSYVNISVASINGGTARPVSFLANSNASSVSWSADGAFILFDTSQRTENGQLARIDLKLRTPKFREDSFRDLFKQENPKDKTPPPNVTPTPTPTPTVSPSTPASPNPQITPAPTSPSDLIGANKPDDSKKTEIIFEDIRKRLSIVPTSVDVGLQTLSPDGKTVLILATSQGQTNLYTLALDELAADTAARQITSTPGFKSDAQFSPDGKEVYYLENGRVNIVSLDKRDVRPLAVALEMNVVFAKEKMEIFKQGWRYLRDNFYDEKYHGADWNAVYATYEPLVQSARTIDEVRRLMNLMVGELNASHLGVGGASAFPPSPIGKLGLRFDRREYETNGRLKITEIITLSPADVAKNISVGDYLLSVDRVKIDRTINLDEQLENKTGKRVVFNFANSPDGANKREVILKPISTGAEKTTALSSMG